VVRGGRLVAGRTHANNVTPRPIAFDDASSMYVCKLYRNGLLDLLTSWHGAKQGRISVFPAAAQPGIGHRRCAECDSVAAFSGRMVATSDDIAPVRPESVTSR